MTRKLLFLVIIWLTVFYTTYAQKLTAEQQATLNALENTITKQFVYNFRSNMDFITKVLPTKYNILIKIEQIENDNGQKTVLGEKLNQDLSSKFTAELKSQLINSGIWQGYTITFLPHFARQEPDFVLSFNYSLTKSMFIIKNIRLTFVQQNSKTIALNDITVKSAKLNGNIKSLESLDKPGEQIQFNEFLELMPNYSALDTVFLERYHNKRPEQLQYSNYEYKIKYGDTVKITIKTKQDGNIYCFYYDPEENSMQPVDCQHKIHRLLEFGFSVVSTTHNNPINYFVVLYTKRPIAYSTFTTKLQSGQDIVTGNSISSLLNLLKDRKFDKKVLTLHLIKN